MNGFLLPEWGPYSKKYAGISKVVTDRSRGVRFDTVVHPTIANSGIPLPNLTVPSAFHLWESAYDLGYYAYRYELEWKDAVYADVSFSRIDAHRTLIRTEFVNQTEIAQNCVLNYFHAIEYPQKHWMELTGAEDAKYIQAEQYTEYTYAVPRPWDHLNPDGMEKGRFFDACFVQGSGLGDRVMNQHVSQLELQPFGCVAGDRVSYTVSAQTKRFLVIGYRTVSDQAPVFQLCWNGTAGEVISFPVSDAVCMYSVDASEMTGDGSLELRSLGGGGMELNFLAWTDQPERLQIVSRSCDCQPVMEQADGQWTLQYPEIAETFYFRPIGAEPRIREIRTGCLEDALISRISNGDPTFDHVTQPFTASFTEKHSDEGVYENFVVHSIFIPAGERHLTYACIGDASLPELTELECEEIYWKAHATVEPMGYKTAGAPYAFSNRLLRTALLNNIVYPIYRHGTYVQHHTPGKRWDCLYTWDSGFIGLGLLDCDPQLAERILDMYLSEEDNDDFAFLFHGSPVQLYLYQELVKREADPTRYASYYPRVRRYYRFIAGKTEGSTTDRFESGLTTTYDYFYNSSGMDDLPPQVAMHRRGLTASAAPAIASSQVIRCAKILKQLAQQFGHEEDLPEYDADIARLTAALQQYAWDEESGYFSYVLHDTAGHAIGQLRTETGENFDKGMDGIYPLIAGACTPAQQSRLIAHIQSEQELFSAVGISAVDMTAGYYIPNGYWNGNVWFPHQWFVWKTMLDLGEGDFAYAMAKRALDSWKREVDHSYDTFEMLNITTGRGGWYHQFGGLSSPVNIWANAYYRPGTVTSGFDTAVTGRCVNADATSVTFCFRKEAGKRDSLLLVSMAETASGYEVHCSAGEVEVTERVAGTLEIRIPRGMAEGEVTVKRV